MRFWAISFVSLVACTLLARVFITHLPQLDSSIGEPYAFSTGAPTKADLWSKLKGNQQKMADSHLYCMLWCDNDDPIFQNSSSLRDSYHKSEDRELYQKPLMETISTQCCHVATKNSFSVLYDTRDSKVLDHEITLATFGTFNRIEALHETMRRWEGPILLVLYVQDHNDMLFAKERDPSQLTSSEQIEHVKEFLKSSKPDKLGVIVYHEKYEELKDAVRIGVNANYFSLETRSPFIQPEARFLSREEAAEQRLALVTDFPVSSLRNAAQDYVETRYWLGLDIDFIPDVGAYEHLKTLTSFLGVEDKVGVVLPHFERRRCSWIDGAEYSYPETFEELDEQWDCGLIRPFYSDIQHWVHEYPKVFNWPSQVHRTDCVVNKSASLAFARKSPVFPKGVQLSKYERWFSDGRAKMNTLYPINSRSTIDIVQYEPYVLLDRVANATHLLMRYNEVYVGRFRDKVSWIMSLRLTGYQLYVANRHFLIHKDHEPSPWVSDARRDARHSLKEKMFKVADVNVELLQSLNLQ